MVENAIKSPPAEASGPSLRDVYYRGAGACAPRTGNDLSVMFDDCLCSRPSRMEERKEDDLSLARPLVAIWDSFRGRRSGWQHPQVSRLPAASGED